MSLTILPDSSANVQHAHTCGGGCNGHHSHDIKEGRSHSKPKKEVPVPKSGFPFINLLNKMPNKTSMDKTLKQFAMMGMNLAPALTVNETLGWVSRAVDLDHLFDYLKPVAVIFTRQSLVDGINKQNAYKPIAASVSSALMIAAKKAYGVPKFIMRSGLAVILSFIEYFENIQHLLGGRKKEELSEYKEFQKHLENHDHSNPNHNHEFKPQGWGNLGAGLGVIELQLNTVTPLVEKISAFLFAEQDLKSSIGRVLFNTAALSTGFVATGKALLEGVRAITGKNASSQDSLVSKIEATICPCCGTVGACANTIAEDVTALAG